MRWDTSPPDIELAVAPLLRYAREWWLIARPTARREGGLLRPSQLVEAFNYEKDELSAHEHKWSELQRIDRENVCWSNGRRRTPNAAVEVCRDREVEHRRVCVGRERLVEVQPIPRQIGQRRNLLMLRPCR